MNNIAQSFYNWYKETIRNPKYRWLLIGASILYLISPIDLAPDFIPIIGWIDDGIIVTLLVTEVSALLTQKLQAKTKTPVNEQPVEVEIKSETIA
ncbi:hypothetical protein C7H19_11320 [Aphanothece hegewaldii CCALA 016]|uniref:DUF1232 domain-containing protein n=1 Tax=Aphanothece hegewaldii CCALA 016 TaxID=2107694 RepID=A0A2T1LY35_9CHRO|nr:DUF1232 domain-containing protein [Aphanothece hegewaldii]PSF37300.1 hypothetical protein C7H19_11320 [Aphanothece hegewaldii CCALA 016]